MNWLRSSLFEPVEAGTAPAAPPAAPPADPASPPTTVLATPDPATPAAVPQNTPLPPAEFLADGKFQKGFAQRLPDDLKGYAGQLQKFDGVPLGDVLKSYAELEKKIGQRVQAPGADAKPEDMAAWRKITGSPEKADDYKIEKPEGMPDEMWNPDLAKGFSEIAHKHALPPSAVAEISAWWNAKQVDLHGAAMQQIETAQAEQIAGLQREWGDKFAPNVQAASRIARLAGLDVEDPTVGNHPAVIKALHKISLLVAEDRQVAPGSSGPALSYVQQADDIQTNPSNPLYSDYHGKHGEARQRAAADRARALRAAGNR